MDGIRIAAGALGAARTSLDVTANNLANVNTAGFRSHNTHLETGSGGRGVNVSSITETQNPGPVNFTGRNLDVALTENNFFDVRQANGRLAFTRDGSFQIDGRGRVATANGDLLDPPVTVPRDAQGVSIGKDGAVSATLPDGTSSQIGQIQPVRFANPQGLSRIGDNLYQPTANSGAGERTGTGDVIQGAIELSNTDIAGEMVNLIKNEKFSAINVAVARTHDEIFGTVLDLKR